MGEQSSLREFCKGEESLYLASSLLRGIVEGVNDYIFVCSSDCRIIYMNRSLMEKIGRDATGEKCHRAIHGYDSVCPFCFHKSVEQQTIIWEFNSPKDDGFPAVLLVRVEKTGRSCAGGLILHDNSGQRRGEEQLSQEALASVAQIDAAQALDINNLLGFISGSLNTLGKYLERMDSFIQAQSDLIEMVTYDGASSGLREKRKALKLDDILEDAKVLIRESLEGIERVRTMVENLKDISGVDEA